MTTLRSPRHRPVAVITLIAGAAGAVGAVRLGLGAPAEPGPGLWPLLASVIVIVASLVALLERNADEHPDGHPDGTVSVTREHLSRVGFTCALLVGFVLLFQWVGLSIPTFAALLVLFRVSGGEGWRTSVVGALLTTAVLYVLFAVVLGVPFPRDLLLAGVR